MNDLYTSIINAIKSHDNIEYCDLLKALDKVKQLYINEMQDCHDLQKVVKHEVSNG